MSYEKFVELAVDLGEGEHILDESSKLFPFEKSKMLPQINRLKEEKQFKIVDRTNKKNKRPAKTLACKMFIAFMGDIETFNEYIKRDYKSLGNLATALFGIIIFLLVVLFI